MKTDTIIKQEGINALIAKLGYVDAERFIVLITKEPFDYTKSVSYTHLTLPTVRLV